MKLNPISILRIAALLALLAGWPTRLPAAGGVDPVPSARAASSARMLAALQQALSATTNVQTGFVQEKQMAVLRQKVIIKGQLAVQQPGLFAWHVTEPIRYNLVLDGATLRQWDEPTGKEQQMSLADNPVFEIVSRQLKAWFGGQFDLLLKDFDAELDPAAPRSITFMPNKDSFARKAIRRVVMTFREDQRYMQEILIEELGGDKTLMTFTNTFLNAAINPAAWEVKPHGR